MSKKVPATTAEVQRRKAQSDAAKNSAKHNQPQDIVEGTVMKRQGKQVHRQHGK